MTDKEVGELWALAQAPALESSYVVKLIRKLVEERARVIYISPGEDAYHEKRMSLERALSDFGIHPESWRKSRD
jgi:hypothetical protein